MKTPGLQVLRNGMLILRNGFEQFRFRTGRLEVDQIFSMYTIHKCIK